jgi:hypothetical protein
MTYIHKCFFYGFGFKIMYEISGVGGFLSDTLSSFCVRVYDLQAPVLFRGVAHSLNPTNNLVSRTSYSFLALSR